MPIIKNLLKFAASRYGYSHARIGFGSRVAGSTVLGKNEDIGRRCYLLDSTLGNNVRIAVDSSMFASKIYDQVVLNNQCLISEVELYSYNYIAERSPVSY